MPTINHPPSGFAFLLCVALVVPAAATFETFEYVGTLESAGRPAEGHFDLTFRLYDGPDPETSTAIGPEMLRLGVAVQSGEFSVDLEIDSWLLPRGQAWLEIEVARSDEVGEPVRLLRQLVSFLDRPETRTTEASGAVVFFNLPSCPSGWSELTAARGRTVVGLGSGGTLLGEVGEPLTYVEVRDHGHVLSSGDQLLTIADGGHDHLWSRMRRSGSDTLWQSWNSSGTLVQMIRWSNGISDGGAGIMPISTLRWDWDLSTDSTSTGRHSHKVSASPTTVSSATLPYVQLLACQKD